MSQINIGNFTRPFVLFITDLILKFVQKRSCHDNNEKCMLLEYIQHSHPHINCYWEVMFLSWDDRIFCKVDSLMIILLSSSLASFSPHSSGGITLIL